jgi:imidazolonepropionase-like amidohydrolase
LSQEEIALIVNEAHRLGKTTSVHCIGGRGLTWCVQAGVDCLEHGYFMTQEDLELVQRSGTRLVLTPGFYMDMERIKALPAALVEPHQRYQAQVIKAMSAVVASGLPYAVGTDGVHGAGALAKEAAYLTELGASPSQALAAATIRAAEVSGIADFTGSLEAGKTADLIAIEGDPLKEISALNQVRLVVKQGRVIRQDKL